MSFKSKVFAATAALTLVGGISAAGATTAAHAATPSCGGSCIDIFTRDFGPSFFMDVFRQGARVGQPIILFKQSNSDPALDFTFPFQGLVSEFFAAGLVSSAVNLHYGGGAPSQCTVAPTPTNPSPCDDAAFEIEYSPFGVATGLCVGTATTAIQGEGVTLQPCGVSAKTVWIADVGGFGGDDPDALADGFFPLINGSDTNFSHPFVLTYPKNGFPTDKPRPQLQVTNLTGFSNGFGPIVGSVTSNQLWSAVFGVLP